MRIRKLRVFMLAIAMVSIYCGLAYAGQAMFNEGEIGDDCCLFNYQAIATNGATDWESFQIDGETYLALANYADATTYNIDSRIYKWDGEELDEFQAIPTNAATDWESFQIDGETYLAVANSNNHTTDNIDSRIYKWSGNSFIEVQAIQTNGAHDWESFQIDGETYLAVANFSNGATTNIDSRIYKWDGNSFIEFQAIPTNGAFDWESFQIDGETYLAVANYFNGATKNIDSRIYKLEGSLFIEIQAIETNGATNWESFQIEGEFYLGVANNSDDMTLNIDSRIYKWNGNSFIEAQAIPTKGAYDMESHEINGEIYLALANYAINVDSWTFKFECTFNACKGDFDSDGDVDGSDLAVFAYDFGRTDCGSEPVYEGDFDSDGDVDGPDLAVFAADFGKTDYLCPPDPEVLNLNYLVECRFDPYGNCIYCDIGRYIINRGCPGYVYAWTSYYDSSTTFYMDREEILVVKVRRYDCNTDCIEPLIRPATCNDTQGGLIYVERFNEADFTANPINGLAPLEVKFTDESTLDGGITDWYWEFGDGATSMEQNPTHIYNPTGSDTKYTVSLTVKNPKWSDTETKTNLIYVHIPVTLHVPADYLTIQAAIDAASNGDTVLVADETYTGEGNKNIDLKGKAITIRSENGPDYCIIDCENDGRGFYIHRGEGEATVIEGFTIKNGNAAKGGGIYCDNSSPTINNCNISHNRATADGGGIYTYTSCTYSPYNPLCTSPTITNCNISDNIAADEGGGIYILTERDSRGSCISPTITNCVIRMNFAKIGGGICNPYNSVAGYQCSPTITNCVVTSNTAEDEGGGTYCNGATITNSTISDNSATTGSGICNRIYSLALQPTITNCIIWPDLLYTGSSSIVKYSDIKGGRDGEGNIDADPLFVGYGDYRLKEGSPCIDAGDNTAVPPEVTTDFESDDRFIDDPLTTDTGNGSPPIVDIGADEFSQNVEDGGRRGHSINK